MGHERMSDYETNERVRGRCIGALSSFTRSLIAARPCRRSTATSIRNERVRGSHDEWRNRR